MDKLHPHGPVPEGARGGDRLGIFVDSKGNPLSLEARVASGREFTRRVLSGGVTAGDPLNYIPSKDPRLPSYVVGAADDLAEQMKTQRKGRWSIDAQVVLSRQRRLRMFGAALFSPHWRPLPDDVKTHSELLSWQHENKQVNSNHVKSVHRVLAEEDVLVHGKPDHRALELHTVEERARARSYWDEAGVTVSGALRVLDDLLRHSDRTHGAVRGSVLIRLVALGGVAIIFSSENLQNADDRAFIGRWLQDIVDTTKGDNRMLEYDMRARVFRRIAVERDEDTRTLEQLDADADR
jgi:hypothetical protein